MDKSSIYFHDQVIKLKIAYDGHSDIKSRCNTLRRTHLCSIIAKIAETESNYEKNN